ncbi:MAG: flagellar export protein FliJ [Desulfobacteraceae bacterium]|nr:flagellar export protein FliJ [Desulfobacteraceae bacterium]
MPFRFRLKTLLRHREFLLHQAQAALGAAEAKRHRVDSEIDRVSQNLRAESMRLEHEQQAGMDIGRYLFFKEHLNYLERELLSLHLELDKASKEVQARKQEMIECDKSVKVLENIETRDREMYKLLQARKDQKKLDDVAVFKDYRDRGGKS